MKRLCLCLLLLLPFTSACADDEAAGTVLEPSACENVCDANETCRSCDGRPRCVDDDEDCTDSCYMLEVTSRFVCNYREVCTAHPGRCCGGVVCADLGGANPMRCLECGGGVSCVSAYATCCDGRVEPSGECN